MPTGTGAWIETRLDDGLFASRIESIDGEILALATTDSGAFRIFRLEDDGTWDVFANLAEPSVPGLERIWWRDIEPIEGHLVVNGSGTLRKPRKELEQVLISATVTATSGESRLVFDIDEAQGGWIGPVHTFDGMLVGLGQSQTRQKSWGPGIWASTDGTTWEDSSIPKSARRSIYDMSTMASADGIAVAVGRNNRGTDPPRVLRSTDGIEWQDDLLPIEPGELIDRLAVTHDGSEFVIVGRSETEENRGAAVAWYSTDGVTWRREALPNTVFGDGDFRPDLASAINGIILVSGTAMHRSSSLYCYEDIPTCRQEITAVWMRDERGWQRLEVPEPVGNHFEAASDGDRIAIGGRAGDGGVLWAWVPGSGTDRLAAPPLDNSPPLLDLPLAERRDRLELNQIYAYPLATGCHGMSYLGYFNETHWLKTTGPASVDSSWPLYTSTNTIPTIEVLYGFAERVADELIEYSVPDVGVVATYEPAPEDFEPTFCL